MRALCRLTLVALLVAAAATTSRAARAAGTSCQLVNATPLVFPPFHAGQPAPVDGVGEIAVSCSATTMVQISLTSGLATRFGSRRMSGGMAGASVGYDIFLDAARTSRWGDGTAGSQPYSAMVPMGQILRIPVYGRIFPLQAAPSGSYSDMIYVIVVF